MKSSQTDPLMRAVELSRSRGPSQEAITRMQAALAHPVLVRPSVRASWAKLATTIAAGGAIVLGGVALHHARSGATTNHDVPYVAARDVPLESPVATATEIPSVAIEDLPVTQPQIDHVSARPTSRSTTIPAADTELTLVQKAQAALASDPTAALALAERHASEFPLGELAQERELIAIEALAKLGRVGEGDARAARFLADHPRTPYRLRLQRALGHAL